MTIENNSDAWHQINNEERQQADLDELKANQADLDELKANILQNLYVSKKAFDKLKEKYTKERKKRIAKERKVEALKSENKKLKKDLEEWDQGRGIKRFLPE